MFAAKASGFASNSRHYTYSHTSSVSSVLTAGRLSNNPFAVKTPCISTVRGAADSTDVKPLLAPSRLSYATETVSSTFRFVLRPSALAAHTAKLAPQTSEMNGQANSSFTLEPPKFSNPFSRGDSEDEEDQKENREDQVSSSTCLANGSTRVTDPVMVEDTHDHNRSLNGPSPSSASSSSSSQAFVFGQNLHERVTNVESNVSSSSSAKTNGDTLFAQAVRREDKSDEDSPSKVSKSLLEAAEEYEKSRCLKRKYDEVEIVTGEEEESNVLQIHCKLYAFDNGNGNWLERGRGLLRLNDRTSSDTGLQSRLVVRTQGSLRVVLNTKIWPGMSVDQPSEKSVRVTALDGDHPRVFLIMASPKDVELLFHALDWRVTSLKTLEDEASEGLQEGTGPIQKKPRDTSSEESLNS